MTKEAVQRQLEELQAFMQTSAYRSLIFTFKTDIAGMQESILGNPPIDQPSISASLVAHGKLEQLTAHLSLFEESCGTLKAKLDDMNEQATQTTQTEQEEQHDN